MRHPHNGKELVLRKSLPPGLARAFDIVGYQLGCRAEELVSRAFEQARNNGELPSWILNWQQALRNSKMDGSGTDFAFRTDVGVLSVNIKNSATSEREFKAKHRNDLIRPIVIDVRHSEPEIYIVVLRLLVEWREEKIKRKR